VIRCDVGSEGDYDGPIIEMYPGKLLLISERLVNALKDASVDNLESGEQHRYFAVIIFGEVVAADPGDSR
jgi:hypothetical protein